RDDDDDSGDNNTGNTANNNNDSYAVPPVIPYQTQGVIFNDIQSIGSNKPIMQILEELQQAGIKDVKATDWFSGPVTVIVQSGLLKPSEDGMFHPEADVSLAEGIAVFAKVIGIAAKDDTPSEAVAKMQEAGLLGDNMDTSRGMSRLDVAKLLGKALGVEPAVITSRDQYPFADFDEITPQERGIVKAMYDLGIIKGYFEDGIRTFRPDTILTRAQLAILVDRVLGAH
ncbi:MAG: S-layer homology domain-containing protein, partial [Pseudomonadota bacterium]